ncbi:hypothetical protein LOK49_LG06G02416 [Camellia lanceoleosa]|uniref:Uncharacterized protein n=1 Tax=Camellia lanceoleosa TaxID=1840588 RepID=A0ACC0HF22_9ERIC|nr:hypothetical protein LOK49_LG06G02416 [Camellia lanceoleosa]
MEGEASCSSISGARKLQNVVERDLILRNELSHFSIDRKGNNENAVHCQSALELMLITLIKELGYEGNEKNAIRILEQALEEEHAACAALYLELENERSTAATAADEAMAIIPRLQDEKASIEWRLGNTRG